METYRLTTASLDFDLKRRPVNVRDEFGLIRFETVPWRDLAEFRAWRGDFDRWRQTTPAVLRTAEDWERFLAWRAAGCPRRAISRLSPLMGAIRVAVAQKLPGFDGLWRPQGHRRQSSNLPSKREAIAALADAMGERLTERMIENDARFASDPRENLVDMIATGDARKVCDMAGLVPLAAIETLLTVRAAGVLRAQIFGPQGPAATPENCNSPKRLLKSGYNYMPPQKVLKQCEKRPFQTIWGQLP